MQSLKEKVIIITGGSRGIGRLLALRSASEGAKVVITGRNNSDLEKTFSEIKKINSDSLFVLQDVSDYNDVKRVVSKTVKKYGRIDILINNAGIYPHKLFKDFEIDEWKKVVEVNLFGTMMMCREVLPYMEKLSSTTGGSIVNIASTSGKRGYEQGTAYTSSKFAITGFSESLFKEIRQYNIRVMTVYPSYVDTSLRDESYMDEIGKGVHLRMEDVADAIISSLKLPQRAMLKEIEVWATNP